MSRLQEYKILKQVHSNKHDIRVISLNSLKYSCKLYQLVYFFMGNMLGNKIVINMVFRPDSTFTSVLVYFSKILTFLLRCFRTVKYTAILRVNKSDLTAKKLLKKCNFRIALFAFYFYYLIGNICTCFWIGDLKTDDKILHSHK